MEDAYALRSVEELRQVYRAPGRINLDKEVHHLDAHCRDFIAHSPFLVLASSDGAGRVDTSPKGGPPGFVTVLDERRLAIPDMSGNHRIDSLRNIVQCDGVSMIFFVPGIGETLRVVGRAAVSREPELLERCRLADLVPNVAIVVTMTTAFIHCAKALRRSGLWEPDRWPDTGDMASPACMFKDHMKLEEPTDEVQGFLDEAYETTTWMMGPSTAEGAED